MFKYFEGRGCDLEDDAAVVDSAARRSAENFAVAGDHSSVRAAAVLPVRELEIKEVQNGFSPLPTLRWCQHEHRSHAVDRAELRRRVEVSRLVEHRRTDDPGAIAAVHCVQ